MKLAPTAPVGVTVTGLQVNDVDAAHVPVLQSLLAEHGVVVLPEQDADDDQFLHFLRSFGQLAFTAGETPVAGYPDLNVISNVGRSSPPRSTFHADTTYVATPPAYTALRAVTIPESGGETLFTNQYLAYDSLPEDVREHLRGRTITHVVTGLDLGRDDETEAEHQVFRRHPVSGRTALYLTTPARCRSISGLDAETATAMVELLYAHSTQDSNIFRHRWSAGDIVMWDNGCVLHRADHAGVIGDRVMHRGMVAGLHRTAEA